MNAKILLIALLLPLVATAAEENYHQRLEALEQTHSTERNADQQLELAQLYYRAGKLEKAYQQADLFLQKEPDSTKGWLIIGDIWREWTQWAQALEAYNHAAKQSPKRPEIHLRRGQALAELGRQEEADKAYSQYRALAGN